MTITENALKFTDITTAKRTTSSNAVGSVSLAAVIDAVNAIPNEEARRMAIAAMKEHVTYESDSERSLGWFRRRDGFLSVWTE